MPHRLKNQRAIIDRAEILKRLEPALAEGLTPQKRRGDALEVFKQAFQAGYAEVRRRFEGHGTGTEAVREHCFLVDQLIRMIYDFALVRDFPNAGKKGEEMSIAAVGGYGRGELSPHSDIDLLFLLPDKGAPQAEKIAEFLLYMLWDLGLKVGHSTRTIEECLRQAKNDITIRTALLETRWLWGEQGLTEAMKRRYRAEVVANTAEEFVEAKLAERDERHEKLGEARYVLEPNLKEGKGGLRDLHTLYWIAKYLYVITDVRDLVRLGALSEDAANRFDKAQSFLWTVRCHLHYLTGRPEDRLTFDMQPEIARRMGYTDHGGSTGVERFMKHYFLIAKDVGDLTRIFCALLEETHKRKPKIRLANLLHRARKVEGFRLEANRLDVQTEADFAEDPVKMIRLFHKALELDLDIHPRAMSLITQNLKRIDNQVRANPEANRLFVDMLTSRKDPEKALRHMNEAGVLGRFVPDFGRVVAQMQYDMYHVFTVDEHTVQAIGILHRIEQGLLEDEMPGLAQIVRTVVSRRALYLAVFLHDIAKGRNGDHSKLGAEVALKVGPRLGLTEEETETASWLVLHHLDMTRTAFKRDIDDPKTIADFVATVQSPERLKLLLSLTAADIRAVGPGIWNNWKAGLLRELYDRALDLISGGISLSKRESRVAAAKAALKAQLESLWKAEEIEAHLARGYADYWTSFDTATHLRHARQVHEAEATKAPLSIDSRHDVRHGITEITIYTGDHPGLFSQIAGAMALSGASILDAKIITMTNGMALDSFIIQSADGEAFDNPSRLSKLAANTELALSGRLRLDKELAKRRESFVSRTKIFKVTPRVLVDNRASGTHTVIEVNGRDRLGLLYDVTAAMTKLHLQIGEALISTYGERVVDVFYVKDVFGMKIENERKIKLIREALTEALAEPLAIPPAGALPAAEQAGTPRTAAQ